MTDKPDFLKGGRGRQAPYVSTHVRVPEPLVPLVELLKSRYLLALDKGNPAPLLEQLSHAIAKAGQEKEKPVNGFDAEEIRALKSKLADLEKENCDLRERMAINEQLKPVNELPELTQQAIYQSPESDSSKLVNGFKKGLTQEQLATRLGRNSANVGRHRKTGDLETWSQALDPDKLAWRFDPKLKKYFLAKPVNG